MHKQDKPSDRTIAWVGNYLRRAKLSSDDTSFDRQKATPGARPGWLDRPHSCCPYHTVRILTSTITNTNICTCTKIPLSHDRHATSVYRMYDPALPSAHHPPDPGRSTVGVLAWLQACREAQSCIPKSCIHFFNNLNLHARTLGLASHYDRWRTDFIRFASSQWLW